MTRSFLLIALGLAIALTGCDALTPSLDGSTLTSDARGPGTDNPPGDDRGNDGTSGEIEVHGRLTAVGSASVSMGGADYAITSSTRLRDRRGRTVPLSAFSVGQIVEIEYVVRGGQNVATKMKMDDN